jgi:hypothetical protein
MIVGADERAVSIGAMIAMWDFDPDEGFFLFCSAAAAVVMAARYYSAILRISDLIGRNAIRWLLGIWPVGCLCIVYIVLARWSDPATVRGHADYMTLFMSGGALWIFGTPLPGISVRDDALERRNVSAAVVAVAAMLGQTFCYAGSNIGSGPTIWTTLVPAFIASGMLVILWLVVEAATAIAETITIERHLASALIFAAFLVLAGVDLGWAMAGDFHDWPSTLRDFALRGWPSAVLAILTIFALRARRPHCSLPMHSMIR